MTINISDDRMVASRSGQWAERVDNAIWRVSWLDGQWNRHQATTAMVLAELVATNPPMNHPYWRNVENFLAELGLDPAVLDVLIDPEPTDDEEASS